jgi:hypothetical protein
MKKYITLFTLSLTLLFALGSCDEDPTDDLYDIIKEDLGYVPKISQWRLIAPAAPTVPAGSNLTFDLRYWSEGQIDEAQFYLIVGTDTSLISEVDYAPAYSKVTKTDSLIFSYQAPALASGTNFSVQSRVTNVGLENYPATSVVALKIQ